MFLNEDDNNNDDDASINNFNYVMENVYTYIEGVFWSYPINYHLLYFKLYYLEQ